MQRQVEYPRIRPTYNKNRKVPIATDPMKNNYGIAPDIAIDGTKDPKYCNILPPAPRSQLKSHYPFNRTPCDVTFGAQFPNNKCMLAFNPDQNALGIVCGDPNNDEFARGNEFARGHDLMSKNKYFQKTPFLYKKTPEVLSTSLFYPLKSDWMKNKKDYKTYPHPKQYINGIPIYRYPYTLINEQKETGYTEKFINEDDFNKNTYILYSGLVILGIILLLR